MAKICPVMSQTHDRSKCVENGCAFWGPIGWEPKYPADKPEDAEEMMRRGESLYIPINGCMMTRAAQMPYPYICGVWDGKKS